MSFLRLLQISCLWRKTWKRFPWWNNHCRNTPHPDARGADGAKSVSTTTVGREAMFIFFRRICQLEGTRDIRLLTPLTILTNRPNKLFVLFEIEKSLLFRNVHYSDTSLSTILTESLFWSTIPTQYYSERTVGEVVQNCDTIPTCSLFRHFLQYYSDRSLFRQFLGLFREPQNVAICPV